MLCSSYLAKSTIPIVWHYHIFDFQRCCVESVCDILAPHLTARCQYMVSPACLLLPPQITVFQMASLSNITLNHTITIYLVCCAEDFSVFIPEIMSHYLCWIRNTVTISVSVWSLQWWHSFHQYHLIFQLAQPMLYMWWLYEWRTLKNEY